MQLRPDPAAMFARAKLRKVRRNQLWRSARLACSSYKIFRASIGAIERAIASQLEAEFGR